MTAAKTGTARSVMSNWLGQGVMFASGIILPRFLDTSLGTAELGVWDFAWSVRSYISVSSLGMGSSSNHHAARYQASGDYEELNRVLSATLALVIYTAWLALAVAGVVALLTPWLMSKDLAAGGIELVHSAQWLVVAMGIAAALKMIQVVYGGSLAGFGRFDLLNVVEIAGDTVLVGALFVLLWMGYGLKAMAVCLALQEIGRWWGKRTMLYRVCPQLCLKPRWMDTVRFREIAGYGTKTLADTVGEVVLNQTVMAFLMYHNGAAALALFSRPRALTRIVTRFIMGYSRVLVSKAGNLQGQGRDDALRKLLIHGGRVGMYLALPASVAMVILREPLMRLWMGEKYADVSVLTVLIILTVGLLPMQCQRATYHFLMGIGRHGTAAVASLGSAVLSAVLSFVLVGVYKLGLVGAAVAVTVPVAIVHLFIVPALGCRAVGLPWRGYWLRVLDGPFQATVPFGLVVLACSYIPGHPAYRLAAAAVGGGAVMAVVVWQQLLPPEFKQRLRARMLRKAVDT